MYIRQELMDVTGEALHVRDLKTIIVLVSYSISTPKDHTTN